MSVVGFVAAQYIPAWVIPNLQNASFISGGTSLLIWLILWVKGKGKKKKHYGWV
jgi:hypothetical protein